MFLLFSTLVFAEECIVESSEDEITPEEVMVLKATGDCGTDCVWTVLPEDYSEYLMESTGPEVDFLFPGDQVCSAQSLSFDVECSDGFGERSLQLVCEANTIVQIDGGGCGSGAYNGATYGALFIPLILTLGVRRRSKE